MNDILGNKWKVLYGAEERKAKPPPPPRKFRRLCRRLWFQTIYSDECVAVKQFDQRRTYEVGTAIPANLETIYKRAPAKSKLRQLLLDMCVWHVQDFKQSIRTPSQMGWGLFETMKVQRKGGNNPLLDVRSYYVKEDEFAQYEARPATTLADGEAASKSDTSVVQPAKPLTTSTQASMPKHHVAEAISEPIETVHNSSTPIPRPRTAIIVPPSSVAAVPEPSTKPHEQATADPQTSAQASLLSLPI